MEQASTPPPPSDSASEPASDPTLDPALDPGSIPSTSPEPASEPASEPSPEDVPDSDPQPANGQETDPLSTPEQETTSATVTEDDAVATPTSDQPAELADTASDAKPLKEPTESPKEAPSPSSESVSEPLSEPILESAPEPGTEQEVAPEPATEQEVASAQVTEQEVASEPATEQKVAPGLATEHGAAPGSATGQEVAPEPANEQEVAPEPATEQEQSSETAEPTLEKDQAPEPVTEQELSPKPDLEPSEAAELPTDVPVPESPDATSETPLKDDPEYSKFFKMLKMGIPTTSVKHKMKTEGVDPAVIDLDPNKSLASQKEKNGELITPEPGFADSSASENALAAQSTELLAEADGILLKDEPEYAKYFKMLSMGIPKISVAHKMAQEGVDPSVLDLKPKKSLASQRGLEQGEVAPESVSAESLAPAPENPPAEQSAESPQDTGGIPLKDEPEYAKFFKMLKMGIPIGSVMFKMETEGVDSSVLDLDPDKPLASQRGEKDQPSPETATADSSVPAPENSSATQSTQSSYDTGGTPLKDDPQYATYFKMLSMGIPKPSVIQKMGIEGVDASVLELDPTKSLASQLGQTGEKTEAPSETTATVVSEAAPETSSSSAPASAPTPALEEAAEVAAGKAPESAAAPAPDQTSKPAPETTSGSAPESASVQAPAQPDTKSAASTPSEAAAPTPAPAPAIEPDPYRHVPLKEHPKYHRYFVMVDMGLPEDYVKQKVTADGLDCAVLDLNPNKSIASQMGTDGKNGTEPAVPQSGSIAAPAPAPTPASAPISEVPVPKSSSALDLTTMSPIVENPAEEKNAKQMKSSVSFDADFPRVSNSSRKDDDDSVWSDENDQKDADSPRKAALRKPVSFANSWNEELVDENQEEEDYREKIKARKSEFADFSKSFDMRKIKPKDESANKDKKVGFKMVTEDNKIKTEEKMKKIAREIKDFIESKNKRKMSDFDEEEVGDLKDFIAAKKKEFLAFSKKLDKHSKKHHHKKDGDENEEVTTAEERNSITTWKRVFGIEFKPTCDLYDEHLETARIPCCPMGMSFKDYGGRKRFCGLTVTVKCFEDNSRVAEMVTTPGRGKVLVVDGGGSPRCALLGDQLAGKAMKNGWEGIIIYGNIRDVRQLATFDIGIKALGSIPRKSVKRGEGQTGIDVRIADVWCRPGDKVYADEDGIVFLF